MVAVVVVVVILARQAQAVLVVAVMVDQAHKTVLMDQSIQVQVAVVLDLASHLQEVLVVLVW
jgi:hypothetical protein